MNVALDFDLYYSVSPEEMEALERVVDAARELARPPTTDGAGQTTGRGGNGSGSRSLAQPDLTRSLAALDAVRAHRNSRNGRRAGTLAPWLHEYLRRSSGRGFSWRPGEPERGPRLVSATGRLEGIL
jgi:hypothetical protein